MHTDVVVENFNFLDLKKNKKSQLSLDVVLTSRYGFVAFRPVTPR